jgi:phosphoribosylamine--glycine ligase
VKVLIIGSGGREHALAWKIAQSAAVKNVYLAPGNGGTAGEQKCENLPDCTTAEAALAFARSKGIDLTVVGPEEPLAQGIVDRFRAAGLAIVGPAQRESALEASKDYAKAFMQRFGVRTAASRSFCDYKQAQAYVQSYLTTQSSVVIKADGLAAGKGVIIAEDLSTAQSALLSLMSVEATGSDAGKTVVIEEFLAGTEVSVLAAVSIVPGKAGVIVPFIAARDHKRRFDGGQGPNTGGMGAIAPVPDFSQAAYDDFLHAILEPTVYGMQQEGMDYRGFIFFGLMIQENRCYLLEYNVRLGDPETQTVLPLLESDMVSLCSAILDGSLATFPLVWKAGAVCTVVAVADGYPGPYRRGELITLEREKLIHTGAIPFMAGTYTKNGNLYTNGGRVCAVSAWDSSPQGAREKAYSGITAVNFTGMQYRTDIGAY